MRMVDTLSRNNNYLEEGEMAEPVGRNLLDVFMPEDLCARCAEQEAAPEITVIVTTNDSPSSITRLAFCSELCKSGFVRGADAIRGVKDA